MYSIRFPRDFDLIEAATATEVELRFPGQESEFPGNGREKKAKASRIGCGLLWLGPLAGTAMTWIAAG